MRVLVGGIVQPLVYPAPAFVLYVGTLTWLLYFCSGGDGGQLNTICGMAPSLLAVTQGGWAGRPVAWRAHGGDIIGVRCGLRCVDAGQTC